MDKYCISIVIYLQAPYQLSAVLSSPPTDKFVKCRRGICRFLSTDKIALLNVEELLRDAHVVKRDEAGDKMTHPFYIRLLFARRVPLRGAEDEIPTRSSY